MLELYRRLPFGNAAYQRLAQLLSNRRRRHRAALRGRQGSHRGRFGTGAVRAGADEATVLEDYLLTETTLATFREQMLDQLSIKLNAAALEQFAYVLSAREEFLMTALGCIRQQYGSTDRWLEAEYGWRSPARSAAGVLPRVNRRAFSRGLTRPGLS